MLSIKRGANKQKEQPPTWAVFSFAVYFPSIISISLKSPLVAVLTPISTKINVVVVIVAPPCYRVSTAAEMHSPSR